MSGAIRPCLPGGASDVKAMKHQIQVCPSRDARTTPGVRLGKAVLLYCQNLLQDASSHASCDRMLAEACNAGGRGDLQRCLHLALSINAFWAVYHAELPVQL